MLTKKNKPRLQPGPGSPAKSLSIDVPLSSSTASSGTPYPLAKFESCRSNYSMSTTVGRSLNKIRVDAVSVLATPIHSALREPFLYALSPKQPGPNDDILRTPTGSHFEIREPQTEVCLPTDFSQEPSHSAYNYRPSEKRVILEEKTQQHCCSCLINF